MNFETAWKMLPYWVKTNRFMTAKLRPGNESFDDSYDDERKECSPTEANLLSSYAYTSKGVELHNVILDLDIEHALIPSTTPGHSHLYINKILSYDAYHDLLTALRAAGIIQQGIIGQIDKHRATSVRLPHIVKEYEQPEDPNADFFGDPVSVSIPFEDEGLQQILGWIETGMTKDDGIL